MGLALYWHKCMKKLRLSAVRHSHIDRTAHIGAGSTVYSSSMGRFSYCAYDCKLISTEIGAFCSLADGVVIGGAQHPLDWVSTSSTFYGGAGDSVRKLASHPRATDPVTRVGNDVWIGERAIVKGGVCIGDGAVIGMGSVVTHDVPPYAIVAGVPARIVRYRFDEPTRERLLASRWWELPEERLRALGDRITDVDAFLKEIEA